MYIYIYRYRYIARTYPCPLPCCTCPTADQQHQTLTMEPLPPYTPSLQISFLLQTQFEHSHRWTPHCVEINSTQLLIRPLIHSHDEKLINKWYSKLDELEYKQYKATSNHQLCHDQLVQSTQVPNQRDHIVLCTAKGLYLEKDKSLNLIQWNRDPIKKYSLQDCRIGLNTDMSRCLSIRCEREQFLLRVPDDASVTSLFAKIACAAELAVPMDSKSHDPLPLKLMPWEDVM